MQERIILVPAKKNYDFIDPIRCIAMMFIVAEHCIAAGGNTFFYGSGLFWTFVLLMQAMKFGTIAFFLIAGFLIADKFSDYSPSQYLKRRFSTTFGPWIFWSLLFVIIDFIKLAIHSSFKHKHSFNWDKVFNNIKGLYFYSNYWFIINFLISIGILSIFRRHLYSTYFGAILSMFTLFYSVNIYYEWILPNHTTAIMGFVFFLWLGAQLHKHWHMVEEWVSDTSYLMIIMVLLLMYSLSLYESTRLYGVSVDPINTLRLSNILYSLIFFTILLKIKSYKFINYINPRETTYGIYLIHLILVVFLLPILIEPLNIKIVELDPLQYVLYMIASFLIIYILTFLIVQFLNNTKARVLLGN